MGFRGSRVQISASRPFFLSRPSGRLSWWRVAAAVLAGSDHSSDRLRSSGSELPHDLRLPLRPASPSARRLASARSWYGSIRPPSCGGCGHHWRGSSGRPRRSPNPCSSPGFVRVFRRLAVPEARKFVLRLLSCRRSISVIRRNVSADRMTPHESVHTSRMSSASFRYIQG